MSSVKIYLLNLFHEHLHEFVRHLSEMRYFLIRTDQSEISDAKRESRMTGKLGDDKGSLMIRLQTKYLLLGRTERLRCGGEGKKGRGEGVEEHE